ncbi:MAG: STAS domain-containing protein [Syntrophobacteraceae bacterium]|nr:STAS domain-containing protein [Desulfobacteraceae bacterium]
MEVIERTIGFINIVSLNGKVDSVQTPAVQRKLLQLLQSGKKYLILDFGEVSFIASMGLRMLLILAKQAKPLHGRIILCRMSPSVHKVLEIAGFLPYFDICESVEEATRAMLD